jgi:hypothetical protein
VTRTPKAPTELAADMMIHPSPPAKQMNRPVANLKLLDATVAHPPSQTVPLGFNKRLMIDLKCLALQAQHTPQNHEGKKEGRSTQIDTIVATTTERKCALMHN